MGLLIRINVALGAVFVAAAMLAGYACWNILETNAKREVFTEAGLMMDSAMAIRAYTANEILPLLASQIRDDFPPQSVSFASATSNAERAFRGFMIWLLGVFVAAQAANADAPISRLAAELDTDAERSELTQRCRMPRKDG